MGGREHVTVKVWHKRTMDNDDHLFCGTHSLPSLTIA